MRLGGVFVFKVARRRKSLVCVCFCLCVCVCVCPSQAQASSKFKLSMVTASDMVNIMHHMLIILTLTFIQGHTDLNRENNKCSIISETVQAILQVCCEDSPTD